jgi:hypothetical protein
MPNIGEILIGIALIVVAAILYFVTQPVTESEVIPNTSAPDIALATKAGAKPGPASVVIAGGHGEQTAVVAQAMNALYQNINYGSPSQLIRSSVIITPSETPAQYAAAVNAEYIASNTEQYGESGMDWGTS